MSASVKIMRSYDYCHFEICLGTDEVISPEQVNEMRKDCARLVDKAVNDYKILKKTLDWQGSNEWSFRNLAERVKQIKQDNPESEFTPEQKAIIKQYEDQLHLMKMEYDYEDDFNGPFEENDL